MNDVITEQHGDLLLLKLDGEVDMSWSGRVRDAILERRLGGEMIRTVRLPLTQLAALSSFHRTQSVLEQVFEGDSCLATLRLSTIELNRLVSREGAVLIED